MPDEREEEPRVRVVDRRMLSDDERAGKGADAKPKSAEAASTPPKLEIIGGGNPQQSRTADAKAAAPVAPVAPAAPVASAAREPAHESDAEEELSAEESAQLRNELEAEQFAAIEQEMGRALTDQEKDSVRAEMERRAKSMASLEVAPMLQQMLVQLSQFAAVHLGLIPNPYTRLIARNDSEARLAIDAFSALLDLLKPTLDPASHRDLARALNELRVKFVSVTGSSTTGPSLIIH